VPGALPRRTQWTGALAGLACLCASCGDEVVNVTSVAAPPKNEPPRIIRQGPSWPSTPIDVALDGAPRPYVVVADPNGLEDISVVLFNVDAAIIRGIIVRPDSVLADYSCNGLKWTETLDISAWLPASLTKVVEDCPMTGERGYFAYGFFSWNPYYPECSGFPRIDKSSPYFGVPTKCGSGEQLLRFGIYPPAVPTVIDVNVTYLDVEYRGLRATVYDAAGESATATFPPLRLVYRSYRETSAPRGPGSATVSRASGWLGRAPAGLALRP
jgi:hypothetical protein